MSAPVAVLARPPRTNKPPNDERMITDFVTLFLEVEAGLRPARHIRPMLSTDLQPVLGNCGRAGQIPSVGTVISQRRGEVWESTVTLHHDGRVTALAVALRRGADGWRVEEITRPGRPPEIPCAHDEIVLVQRTWAIEDVPPGGPTWQIPAGWAA